MISRGTAYRQAVPKIVPASSHNELSRANSSQIDHLPHLRAYIARNDPKAASRIAGALLEAVERLAELPNLGRPG